MCVSESFEASLTEPPSFSHVKGVGSASQSEQPGASSLGVQPSSILK